MIGIHQLYVVAKSHMVVLSIYGYCMYNFFKSHVKYYCALILPYKKLSYICTSMPYFIENPSSLNTFFGSSISLVLITIINFHLVFQFNF
jgi:hypothetical protein